MWQKICFWHSKPQYFSNFDFIWTQFERRKNLYNIYTNFTDHFIFENLKFYKLVSYNIGLQSSGITNYITFSSHIRLLLCTEMKFSELSQDLTFANKLCVLCLQVLKISLLLLSVLPSVLYIIKYFSFKHSMHFLLTGLNVWAFSNIFHVISKSRPLSFRSQICPLNLLFVLFFGLAKSCLCSCHLFLNGRPVNPVYVSIFPEGFSSTQAW